MKWTSVSWNPILSTSFGTHQSGLPFFLHKSRAAVEAHMHQVSRIEARSEQFDMYMQLDVNTEAYPLHVGDKFTMVLAPTLSLDGTPDSYFTQGGRESLADKFEYAMHGKLYKISVEGSGANVKVEIYASFGGLLMMLTGYPANAANFQLDQRLFLLMRKV